MRTMLAAAFALVLAFSACISFGAEAAPPAPGPRRHLTENPAWHGENRARLDRMIGELGRGSPGFDPEHAPLAILDWDNTMVKNDIGQATFYWMLENNRVRMPVSGNWRDINPHLTVAAIQALDASCRIAAAGRPLPTRAENRCATELLNISRGKTSAGEAAFAGHDHRYMKPTAAFMAEVHWGYTPDESRDMARQAIEAALAQEVGETQTVGTVEGVPEWVRIYEPMKDLAETLAANGFEVWVVSASPQTVVEVLAAEIGVPRERVIGIRNVVAPDGLLEYFLEGCGPQGDGRNQLITYGLGKRCWINKVIHGIDYTLAMDPTPELRRHVFAAGDSSTDLTFVGDAKVLRLVINRNDPALMCPAYHGLGAGWLVNPMFIEPLAQRSEPYACSTTACKDAKGKPVPCLDAGGEVIPDQEDRVFASSEPGEKTE